MRYSAAIAVVGVANAQQTPVGMSFGQFGETVEGITFGFLEQQMPHLVQCAGQSEDVVRLVGKAFTDFGKGDSEGIGDGFIDIGQTIKEFPRALQGCEEIVNEDIQSFSNLSKTFADFGTFTETIGENWLLNDDVPKRWNSANAFVAKGDYYHYGENLGIMVDELLQPLDLATYQRRMAPTPTPQQPVWAIVLEVIFGLPAGFTYAQMPHLGACVAQSDDMVEKLVGAGYAFATGTYKGIAKGFYDLGDLVLDIPHTIKNCPQVDEDAKTWAGLGATFKDFGTFCTAVS